MKCSIEEKRNILEQAKGGFFSVCFKKKDNTIREMTCKKFVKAYLHGEVGENKNTVAHIDKYYTVCEINQQSFKNVNLETLVSCKVNGKTYSFEGEE